MPLITTEHPNPIQAKYKDGFTLNEAAERDVSLYRPGRNTMYDIANFLPVKEHGPMVEFSIFVNDWINIDWTKVPENSKPIRFKNFEQDQNGPNVGKQRLVKIVFGFEYFDESLGKNVQTFREMT